MNTYTTRYLILTATVLTLESDCRYFKSETLQIQLEKLQFESFQADRSMNGPISVLLGETGGATASMFNLDTYHMQNCPGRHFQLLSM